MTPEQEIRAAAVQAAATFCGPLKSSFEDVQYVAGIFAVHITDGPEAALRLHEASQPPAEPASAPEAPTTAVKNVELREERPVEDVEVFFEPDPLNVTQAAEEDVDTAPEVPVLEGPPADVIPITARGAVPQAQNSARRKIEKMRHERAVKILNLAATAKAIEHKRRLADEAEEAGLFEYRMEIDGQVRELGPYLASL